MWISDALCSESVGGVVPRILCFIPCGFVFFIAVSIVSANVFLRDSSRFSQTSGVSISNRFSLWVILGKVLLKFLLRHSLLCFDGRCCRLFVDSNATLAKRKPTKKGNNGVFFDIEAKKTPLLENKLFSKQSEHIR